MGEKKIRKKEKKQAYLMEVEDQVQFTDLEANMNY